MSVTTEDIKMLSSDFPKEDIHWRAQTITKNGDKALALAYLDARNVMDRLDEILGVENWQDRYEVHGQKTICYLSIQVDGEWVTKADGAGDTQVEAEKGSISDAFKRAAVKWGIGRYLYSLDAVWVPCETYERNGKKVFSKFKADPWSLVRGFKPLAETPEQKARKDEQTREAFNALIDEMRRKTTVEELGVFVKSEAAIKDYNSLPKDWQKNFNSEIQIQKQTLTEAKTVNA